LRSHAGAVVFDHQPSVTLDPFMKTNQRDAGAIYEDKTRINTNSLKRHLSPALSPTEAERVENQHEHQTRMNTNYGRGLFNRQAEMELNYLQRL
jgi:hypothetical protein